MFTSVLHFSERERPIFPTFRSRKKERGRAGGRVSEGKKRSFQVGLFADKGKQWTDGRTDRVDEEEEELTGHTWHIFGSRGRERGQRPHSCQSVTPWESLEPFKKAFRIHFASIKRAN